MAMTALLTSDARGSSVPVQQTLRIGPELLVEVADHPAEKSIGAADECFPRRRHARRQPRVLDDVVERVADVASPRRREMAVAALREKDGFRRVSRPRADAVPARRNVPRLLAPDRAEAGL